MDTTGTGGSKRNIKRETDGAPAQKNKKKQ